MQADQDDDARQPAEAETTRELAEALRQHAAAVGDVTARVKDAGKHLEHASRKIGTVLASANQETEASSEAMIALTALVAGALKNLAARIDNVGVPADAVANHLEAAGKQIAAATSGVANRLAEAGAVVASGIAAVELPPDLLTRRADELAAGFERLWGTHSAALEAATDSLATRIDAIKVPGDLITLPVAQLGALANGISETLAKANKAEQARDAMLNRMTDALEQAVQRLGDTMAR